MCVLCTLLFMMSIEALGVKREKEKKKSSRLVLELFHFFCFNTTHTHQNHKIRTRNIKSNRLISASHLAKIKRVIKVWVRIRND